MHSDECNNGFIVYSYCPNIGIQCFCACALNKSIKLLLVYYSNGVCITENNAQFVYGNFIQDAVEVYNNV